jgi:ABC-type transporter MlaC component
MKKTLLGIALSVAMLPVMSFAQAAPASTPDQPAAKTTKKTKKHVRKAKHSKKAAAESTTAPAPAK